MCFKKQANFPQVGAISGNTNIDEEFRPQASQTHNVFNINFSDSPIRACILLYFFCKIKNIKLTWNEKFWWQIESKCKQ